MFLTKILGKAVTAIIIASGTWVGCVLICTRVWIQRQLFYAHKLPIWWGQKLDKPETFGYLKNQVIPFRIPTSDGERLYAWLVSPLRVYGTHEREFCTENPRSPTEVQTRLGFKLLKGDPENRLVIYFHGNAGTVGQTRRTDAYRMVASGASDKIFVLAFDYRGFGHSTGNPTEEGLITDAISTIKWAIEVAGVPPDRIVLVAQSLGTGLATAAAAHFITSSPKIEFGGLVLCATFTCAPIVFLNFSIKGWVPLLAPLRFFPTIQTWFKRSIKDTWRTSDRLATLVKQSKRLRLTLFHATSDEVIPWNNCNELFYAAVNATMDEDITFSEIDDGKEAVDLGDGGWSSTWASGDVIIRQNIVKHGGHNGIMKWAPVALATLRSFELA